MILKAKHHFLIYPFFKWYAAYIVQKSFEKIELHCNFENNSQSVLLIMNHFSWWDGFFAMIINQSILHKKFHFMMLESQLLKYRFFNYTGGYSISKKARSMIESIHYTIEILKNKNNMVLMFPQGKIESMHQQTFSFENGISKILNQSAQHTTVIFAANIIDYFSNKKPTVTLNVEPFKGTGITKNDLEESYNQFYARCIDQQIKNNSVV